MRFAAEARAAEAPAPDGRRRRCADAPPHGHTDAQTTSATRNAGNILLMKRNTLGRARDKQTRDARGRETKSGSKISTGERQFSVFSFQSAAQGARRAWGSRPAEN